MNPYQLTPESISQKARAVRRRIIHLNSESPAGGHTGADLSQVEILCTLYFREMNVSPDRIDDPERDIYIQSKGHAVGCYYCVLAEAGYIPEEWLKTYQHSDSKLPGHPVRQKTPAIELNTGALGHGLPVGVGLALAAKMSGSNRRVFVVCGDGELAEGSIYEAALCAAKYKLDNLTVIIDHNKLQLAGPTKDIMPLDPLVDKWEAFNWAVSECNGNEPRSLIAALEAIDGAGGKPSVIIAHTKKGAGISFIEDQPAWHHRVPKGDEIERALAELGD
ncbi:transketolase [Enterovibrio paralichthyis]|uniref:transketolase n=1 Tax=Enterovibrio paralichthyis TaxID=2853805 RepID=UPI001C4774C4|nr:transketolase [Enterovibrio paralichthyis]MBV7297862.1 transketolase [Enterovibrio paralichthyis]